MIYNVEKLGTINIGRHGENLARVIEIDVSSMLKQWPDATITLLVKRNKDEAPYVAVTELVDGILYWPVTRAETAVPGNGLIEIRATRGETIAKSVTGFIRVSAALTGNETKPPEQAKSWVDQVIEYGNEATQAAIKAKEEADRLSGINAKAVTLPEGSEATVIVEEGCLVYGIPKGDKGDPGNDGYTPVKGVDYFDGEPGKDGTDATVTKDSIKTALGYTPADDADMAGKLTEPASGLAVGKYFRIAAIDENGHAVLEAVDAPVGGVQDVLVNGASIVADGMAGIKASGYGIGYNEVGLYLSSATANQVSARKNSNVPITPTNYDYAVKAAMCDGNGAAWTSDEQAAARERMGEFTDSALTTVADVTMDEDVSVFKAQLANPCRFITCTFIIPPEIGGQNRNIYFAANVDKADVLNMFARSAPVSTTSTISAFYLASALIVGRKILSFGCIASNGTSISDHQTRPLNNPPNGFCVLDAQNFETITVYTYGTAFPAGSRLVVTGC